MRSSIFDLLALVVGIGLVMIAEVVRRIITAAANSDVVPVVAGIAGVGAAVPVSGSATARTQRASRRVRTRSNPRS